MRPGSWTWRGVPAGGEWRAVVLRVVLLAVPASALAWRPISDPAPDRWGHADIELAVAYLSEGRLESAIDAMDDARALDGGAADRAEALLAEGPVHDRLGQLVADRLGIARSVVAASDVDRARWLRQLPGTRAQGRRLLEGRLRSAPDDPAAWREWGAWWLGESADPDARPRARSALARACRSPAPDPSAAVLIALLDSDPRPLAAATSPQPDRRRERARRARAIVAPRRRPEGEPGS